MSCPPFDPHVILTLIISGENPWPFKLLIQVQNHLYTYKPKSDFLMMEYGLPHLLVEVQSKGHGEIAADRIRMLLQGASVVRFANAQLEAYKKERNFLLVAIYIDGTGMAERSILFQKKDGNGVC